MEPEEFNNFEWASEEHREAWLHDLQFAGGAWCVYRNGKVERVDIRNAIYNDPKPAKAVEQ